MLPQNTTDWRRGLLNFNKEVKEPMAGPFTLESFDPAVETVDDCKERFDFHCTALGIREERQKALFLTRIRRDGFVKVKTLASPTPLADLILAQIVKYMKGHYKKETVEIAERFKFFTRIQQDKESLADYWRNYRHLQKHATSEIT